MVLGAIWQFMDRDVTHKILYVPKQRALVHTIYYFVGDRPVLKLLFGPKCYELFVIYILIVSSIFANLSDDMFFCYFIFKTKNEFRQNPEENMIMTRPTQYTVILTGSLTKTNRENINVKHDIVIYHILVNDQAKILPCNKTLSFA